jgi:glutamate carboxypeptidase
VSQAGELAGSILQAAERARPELLERLMRLSAVDAPSGEPEALGPAADAFAAELADLGGELERHASAGITHLSTLLGPPGGGHVLILGHYDTVWPSGTAAERPPRAEGRRIYGPGVFDMRGGIVAALGALRIVGPERLPRPVQVLLTGDEETGSASSGDLIVRLAREASLVLVTEPPLAGGGLKTARKGWSAYTLEVTGRAAHAGLDPEAGVSAIEELLHALLDVTAMRAPELGTTVNLGTVSGGTRPNVVAAHAEAELEVRAVTAAEQERVDRALRSLGPRRDGAALTVTRRHTRPPMERTPAVAAAAQRAKELAGALGMDLAEGAAGGTSDANLLAPLGVPVLDGLGPDGGGAHALDEHILVDALVQRTALIASLLAEAA